MVSIGIVLNIWINKQVTAEIVVAGALSGLASIGTHQTCKNLNHNKKDQENNKTIIKMNNEMKKIVKINNYNQPSFKHTKLNKKLFDEKSTLSV